ncbi:MAG: hypothetical protein OHK0023_15680 [Anaerolineae bacterium]
MTNVTPTPSSSPSIDPRTEAQLNALSEAVRAVTAEFSLERILRRLAEIAANMVHARYAALGVPEDGKGLREFLTFGISDEAASKIDHLPEGKGLLGALLHDHDPIRLANIREDPRSVGFPANHPEMTRFLGVPIVSKGKNLGTLYLTDRIDGQPFSEEDERMISLLAAHAAIAIENAKLSDQLRRLAVLEERDRISMELHDGIIQSIYAIGIKLQVVRLQVNDEQLSAQIRGVNQDLDRVIEDLRRYIKNLQASVELSLTLREQMDDIAERFRQVTDARLVMDISPNLTQLSEAHLHALLQITREALSNVVRHAHATEVYVDLHETPTHITLVVADNGIGFEPMQVPPGIGIRNIRQRVSQLNGTVELESRIGRGATLTIALPVGVTT